VTLFDRNPHADSLRAEAHRILDDARAGLNVSPERITWALRITGDLT
jgi:hypothetical protein